jgi:hypothetical protein
MKKLALAALTSAIIAAPLAVQAESTTINPAASGSTASAHLDFTIVVPPVLYLRIGAGSAIGLANNTNVDSLTFNVPAANLGDGTVIAAGAADGDLGNGAVTVRVFSNFGTNVNLNSSVSGQLLNAAVSGDVIPWSQIAVAGAALASTTTGYTNGAITHPAFSATSGVGTPTLLTAASKLVRQEGKWTFTYSNTNPVPAGTYGSNTAGKNGRVTYTASQV